MNKVPVDRELLERVTNMLDAHNYAKDAEALMAAIAQPAEAEGVERWSELRALAESAPGENWKAGNAYGKPFIPTYQVIADTVDGPCVILEGNKNFIEQAKAAVTFAAAANPAAVRELIAALSAVTAERDRIENELEETELRALKFFHRFSAATDLGRELREALELIEKSADGEQCRQIAYDALEPFRARAAMAAKEA